jgi:hypothetical protein
VNQKYSSPESIPNETIQEAFAKSDSVKFLAKRFNHIPYRSITFGDFGWWLPLSRVLPIIGITPQVLRPVFNPQRDLRPRHFPFNLKWFGLNKNRYEITDVDLPKTIKSYEKLGFFRLNEKNFLELAKILGKVIEVIKDDGSTGEYYHLFSAYPSGEIVKVLRS